MDGHDVGAVHDALAASRQSSSGCPQAIVARTVKGKGVPSLESDVLCHVKTLNAQQIAEAIRKVS